MAFKVVKHAGVLAVILAGFYVISACDNNTGESAMSTSEKWQDWNVVSSASNADNSISAVLERNFHFGREGFKPIIRVSLSDSSGLSRVVWQSGDASSPKLVWKNNTDLSIQYEHNLTVGFQPSVRIGDVEYRIILDMNIDRPPHYTEVWDDGWRWEKIEEIRNNKKRIVATVLIGEHSISNSAPIARVLLEGEDNEPLEVWSGTESTSRPVVTWIDADTLLILVEEYHSYTYFPAKKIDDSIYKIVLQKSDPR